MQIQTIDEIEGVPLQKIRALFRRAGWEGVVSANFVRRQLRLTKSKTDRVIAALRRKGLLEPIRARRVKMPTKQVATVQEQNPSASSHGCTTTPARNRRAPAVGIPRAHHSPEQQSSFSGAGSEGSGVWELHRRNGPDWRSGHRRSARA